MFGSSKPKKVPAPVFVAMTVVIFFLSLSAADSIGFVPCYLDETCPAPASVSLANLPELGESSEQRTENSEQNPQLATERPVLPERIIISKIDLDLPVQNPQTRNIDTLDELLKQGPVRYVDSAKLGEAGNVLIFAHTSHLPVVHNQMYKAFNRIPELKTGDSISVQGEGKSYLYTVRSVQKIDVDVGSIDLSPSQGKRVTLVTCDTLSGKSARFVLEADFVGAF